MFFVNIHLAITLILVKICQSLTIIEELSHRNVGLESFDLEGICFQSKIFRFENKDFSSRINSI
jgi:hypothetical protein